MAFSMSTKRIIKHRARMANPERRLVSEVSGTNTYKMHAAHYNHRKDENYDNPDNGVLLTLPEHFYHHLSYRGKAELMGLTEEQNENAIKSLYVQMMINKFELGEISYAEMYAIKPDYFTES